ncbi:MAG: sulfite exporter TauE/SafE family protein [Proteobacteria bacterium]|nr:sulfite exporter TauE/SafE family protein [Pseudomonadota bacterium]
MTSFALLGLGLFAGICSGLFGIGGGIVIVPGLVFLLGFQQATASGTSLVAMLLPVGALGVWQYFVAGKIGADHLKFGAWIALGMFIGAYFGGKLASQLPVQWMQRLFSGLLVFAAFRLFRQSLQ